MWPPSLLAVSGRGRWLRGQVRLHSGRDRPDPGGLRPYRVSRTDAAMLQRLRLRGAHDLQPMERDRLRQRLSEPHWPPMAQYLVERPGARRTGSWRARAQTRLGASPGWQRAALPDPGRHRFQGHRKEFREHLELSTLLRLSQGAEPGGGPAERPAMLPTEHSQSGSSDGVPRICRALALQSELPSNGRAAPQPADRRHRPLSSGCWRSWCAT